MSLLSVPEQERSYGGIQCSVKKGASVLLLEKMPKLGGDTFLSGGCYFNAVLTPEKNLPGSPIILRTALNFTLPK